MLRGCQGRLNNIGVHLESWLRDFFAFSLKNGKLLGMVAQAYSSVARRLQQGGSHEFEANPGYIVSSRKTWDSS